MERHRFRGLAVNERSVGPLSNSYCVLRLLCASAALDLQMDRTDVRLQGAGHPKRHAFAVGTRVVPALLVHRLDVRLRDALRLVGDAGAVQ